MDRVMSARNNSWSDYTHKNSGAPDNNKNISRTEGGWFHDFAYNLHGNLLYNHNGAFGHAMQGSKNWACLFVDNTTHKILINEYTDSNAENSTQIYHGFSIVNGTHSDVLEKLKDCLTTLSKHHIEADNKVKVLKTRLNVGDGKDLSLMVVDVRGLHDGKLDENVNTALGTFFKNVRMRFGVINIDDISTDEIKYVDDKSIYLAHNFNQYFKLHDMWIEWPLNWFKPHKTFLKMRPLSNAQRSSTKSRHDSGDYV
jgi:hypothetical protein